MLVSYSYNNVTCAGHYKYKYSKKNTILFRSFHSAISARIVSILYKSVSEIIYIGMVVSKLYCWIILVFKD